jgi:sec1 family domain-containing protein 1
VQAQLVTAVSHLLDGSQGRSAQGPTAADTFLVIDPRKEAGKSGADGQHVSARDAIVFMIGGGNYLERERLAQWALQCSPRRNVIYSATEMLTGEQFCAQLALLGAKSASN